MTIEEREELRQNILLDIEEVKVKIENLEELTKPIPPDNAIGSLTCMDAINNRNLNEASLNSARAKLYQLERMLADSDKAEFGLCAICGEPIAIERLRLMPENNRCIKCATR